MNISGAFELIHTCMSIQYIQFIHGRAQYDEIKRAVSTSSGSWVWRLRPCTACPQLSCHSDLLILNIWTCPRSGSHRFASACTSVSCWCISGIMPHCRIPVKHPSMISISPQVMKQLPKNHHFRVLQFPLNFAEVYSRIQCVETSCFVTFQQVNLGKTNYIL